MPAAVASLLGSLPASAQGFPVATLAAWSGAAELRRQDQMPEQLFRMNEEASTLLREGLSQFDVTEPGIAISLASVEENYTHHGHAVDIVGIDTITDPYGSHYMIDGIRLWIAHRDARVLVGREVTVAQVGTPSPRPTLVIKDMSEDELRIALLAHLS